MYVLNKGKLYYVYMYTSPSGRHYIGRTCNSQNIRAKYNGRGYESCTAFWRAIQKYGWENFKYEILEDGIPADKIKERENYWIGYYHSSTNENGYNLLMPDEDLDTTFSDEVLQKMSKSHIGKEPWNKGKKGIYSEDTLKRMSESHKPGNSGRTKKQKAEVARQRRANSGKKHMTKEEISKKSRERFFGEYDPNDTNLGYHVMPVSQFDLDGNFIKTYKSAVQAEEITGVRKYNIRRCCRGELSSSGGFQWCDVGNEDGIKECNKQHGRTVPVAQILDDAIINIFPTIADASKSVNVHRSCIDDVIRGKNLTSAGYKWKRIKDVDQKLIDDYYASIGVYNIKTA